MRRASYLAALLAGALWLSDAGAVQLLFFGEDLNDSELTPLAAWPNAESARNSFLSYLDLGGTDDLEAYADGESNPILQFGGGFDGDMAGGSDAIFDMTSIALPTNIGRYALSGDKYWEAPDDFDILFGSPVNAFGFYGVDMGDFGGQLQLEFNGSGQTLDIGHSVQGSQQSGNISGSVFFFGIIDTEANWTKVDLRNVGVNDDGFGFDDFAAGRYNNIVPEPGSLALLGLGCGALIRRRRR